MNIIADVVILAILFFCTYLGYKKGFILTFFNFFSGLFSMIIASVFAHPVGDYFATSFMKPVLTGLFSNRISERLAACAEESNPLEVLSAYVSRFGVTSNDLQVLWDCSANSLEKFTSSLVNMIVSLIADTIAYSLSLVVIFIVVFVLLKLLVRVLDLIAKLPFLNLSNHFLGFLFGFFNGCCFAFVFVTALIVLEPFIQGSEAELLSGFSLEKTHLAKFFML